MAKRLSIGNLSSVLDNESLSSLKREAILDSSWPSEKAPIEKPKSKEPSSSSNSEPEKTDTTLPFGTITRRFPPNDRMVSVELKKIDPSRAKIWDGNPRPNGDATSLIPKIVATKGNTQAALVRPLQNDPDYDFEIVYGQRRRTACLETGFELYVEIALLTDEEAEIQTHMENEGRESVDVFSMGRYYSSLFAKAKSENPDITERGFAEKKGMGKSQMNNYLRLSKFNQRLQNLPTKIDVEWSGRQGITAIGFCEKLSKDELNEFIEDGIGKYKTPAICLKALEYYLVTKCKIESNNIISEVIKVGAGKVTIKRTKAGNITISADKNVNPNLIENFIKSIRDN